MMFDMEKLKWFCYPVLKKIENTITGFDNIHERDRRTDVTDRHRMTAYAALV